MEVAVNDLAGSTEDLATGLAHAVASARPGWLALGVALHLGNQVARGRGWWAIVHAATAGDPRLRRRDAIAAWIAGAGAGGVVTARVGDALRVALLGRRLPDTGGSVVAGSLVAEAAGELAGGVLLLALALALGIHSPLVVTGPVLWCGVAAVAVIGALVVLVLRRLPAAPARSRAGRVLAGVRHGCAPLGEPRTYLRRVAPWQFASRACRLVSTGCLLAAFHLPATPAAVLLVVFAQGSGRLVPFSPVAVGAGVAVLTATFGPVTGSAASAAQLGAFVIGTSTVLTTIGVLIAAAVTLRAADWRTLPTAIRRLRRAPAQA
jgi:hypothetical protein